jgi:nucleoside-diphosphate-sugar epimerase
LATPPIESTIIAKNHRGAISAAEEQVREQLVIFRDAEKERSAAGITAKRVLVTGASGFVGSHLCERLRTLGWSVIGLGRRPVRASWYVRHDLESPLPLPVQMPVDVVIHAAARASPWGRRRDFESANVRATRQLLNACVRQGMPRFVFISSSSVYYSPRDQLGITEKTPLPARQINAYAATKRRAEKLVQQYPGEWVILRPRAVFGPGDTVLMPRILRAAAAGRLPILEAPGGPVTGDLIYIDNLVDAIARTAEDRRIKGCINLTNNEPVAIVPFLLDILQRLGIQVPTRHVAVARALRIAGLIEFVYGLFLPDLEPPITRFGVHVFAYSKTFNVDKMLATIGPPRISIDEGVRRTVAWFAGGGRSSSKASTTS